MFKEWQELIQLCPEENRVNYQHAKECGLVKVCLLNLRHSEYDMAAKELLIDIKSDRKLARVAAGEDAVDLDEANLEDWEFRNYKDDWVPSYETLRVKLVRHFKEMTYHKSR